MFRWKSVVSERPNDLEFECPLAGDQHVGQSLCACLSETRIRSHVLERCSDSVSLTIWSDARPKRFVSNATSIDRAQSRRERIDDSFKRALHGERLVA